MKIETAKRLQSDHLAYMDARHKEGKLVMAGPIVDLVLLRGLFSDTTLKPGTVLAFARSLGEFGATLTLSVTIRFSFQNPAPILDCKVRWATPPSVAHPPQTRYIPRHAPPPDPAFPFRRRGLAMVAAGRRRYSPFACPGNAA